MRDKLRYLIAFFVLIATIALLNNLELFDRFVGQEELTNNLAEADSLALTELEPELREEFGLPVDSFELIEDVVDRGESFGKILLDFGVDYATIHRIANDYNDVFDVRMLRSGKPYTIFAEQLDDKPKARYMVYEPSATQYVVFDLQDSVRVYRGEKEVELRQKEISGIVESSLYEALVDQGGSPALAVEISKIYAWTIDFFRIQPGDYFKLIYEEKYVDGEEYVGLGKIIAANFYHQGKSFYAFNYNDSLKYRDYYDKQGRSLRKAFLKAPLDYFRISSRFNRSRFHPVLKRVKPHLGTDYAAPRGTPIRSTADGEVIAASYTRGNGNYVKVKHNSTYTTQYLHMSKFAKGIKKGVRVRQGDVIGYVGSTGLATGPHVCYRFWVNGQQVDPLKQDLPEAEPIEEEYIGSYRAFMLPLKEQLDQLALPLQSDEDQALVRLASAG